MRRVGATATASHRSFRIYCAIDYLHPPREVETLPAPAPCVPTVMSWPLSSTHTFDGLVPTIRRFGYANFPPLSDVRILVRMRCLGSDLDVDPNVRECGECLLRVEAEFYFLRNG